MTEYLRSLHHKVNLKRVRRLMRKMGLEAIYCNPNLNKANKECKILSLPEFSGKLTPCSY